LVDKGNVTYLKYVYWRHQGWGRRKIQARAKQWGVMKTAENAQLIAGIPEWETPKKEGTKAHLVEGGALRKRKL